MEREINLEHINRVSEIELVYKSQITSDDLPKVSNGRDAYEVFIQYWNMQKMEIQEQSFAMFIDAQGRAMAIYSMSIGGLAGTVIDPRLIFSAALSLRATAVILAHNHPGGNLKPSSNDKKVTERLVNGGALLDIKVHDHLIITREGYYSMAEHGDM